MARPPVPPLEASIGAMLKSVEHAAAAVLTTNRAGLGACARRARALLDGGAVPYADFAGSTGGDGVGVVGGATGARLPFLRLGRGARSNSTA